MMWFKLPAGPVPDYPATEYPVEPCMRPYGPDDIDPWDFSICARSCSGGELGALLQKEECDGIKIQ